MYGYSLRRREEVLYGLFVCLGIEVGINGVEEVGNGGWIRGYRVLYGV